MLKVRTKWKAESVRGNSKLPPAREREISKSANPGESGTLALCLSSVLMPLLPHPLLSGRSSCSYGLQKMPLTPTPGLPYLWLPTCSFALELDATFSGHVKEENRLTVSLHPCFPWHVGGHLPMLKLDRFQECPASDGSSLHRVRMPYCFQIFLILIGWDFPWLFSLLELNLAVSISVLWTSRRSPCVWWFPHPGIFNWPWHSWLKESKGHHHC